MHEWTLKKKKDWMIANKYWHEISKSIISEISRNSSPKMTFFLYLLNLLDFLWVVCGVWCWCVCGGGCSRNLIQSPSRIMFPLLDCSAWLRLQSCWLNLSGFLHMHTCSSIWRCHNLPFILYFALNRIIVDRIRWNYLTKLHIFTGDCRKLSHDC